jgi:hypothetical protein
VGTVVDATAAAVGEAADRAETKFSLNVPTRLRALARGADLPG